MPPFGFPIFPDFLSAGENVFCNSEMPVHVFNYGRMSIDHSFSYCSCLLKCTQKHSVMFENTTSEFGTDCFQTVQCEYLEKYRFFL